MPGRLQVVDGVQHLPLDRLLAGGTRGQPLEPGQDHPLEAGLRRLVAEGHLEVRAQLPSPALPVGGAFHRVTKGGAGAVNPVGVVEREER